MSLSLIGMLLAPIALSGSGGWEPTMPTWGAPVAITARDRSPSLVQMKNKMACISDSGHGGACRRGVGLRGPSALVMTRSGRQVYVAADRGSALVTLHRGRAGGLTAGGCISERRLRGCEHGRGLKGASSIALSPNQKQVYVVGDRSDDGSSRGSLALFARDTRNGKLKQIGCFEAAGEAGCMRAPALEGATSIVVSDDGRDVYVGATNIVGFRRDPRTGRLVERGCVGPAADRPTCATRGLVGEDARSGLALAPEGDVLWSSDYSGDLMTILGRDRRTGGLSVVGCKASDAAHSRVPAPIVDRCGVGKGRLDEPTVSPDGRWLYTYGKTGGDGIAISHFRRGHHRADLSFAGCMGETEFAADSCTRGHAATDDPEDLAITGGGSLALTVNRQVGSIAILRRNPATGRLSPGRGRRACVSEDGTAVDRLASPDARGGILCTRGRAVFAPIAITASPDGRHAYVAAYGSDAISVFAVHRRAP